MTKPRLLDLFSGAGGCAVGYHRAGFEVVGVNLRPQPRYPFEFHQADALEFVAQHGHEFDAIHASPPCQAYSPLRALAKHIDYPDLLPVTRDRLISMGVPWVIENVPGSPIRSGVMLCGSMFPGLRVYRHRWFETPFMIMQPAHPRHVVRVGPQKGRRPIHESGGFLTITGDPGSRYGDVMGIDWMTGAELSQAIPPAYTEFIGRHLMHALVEEAAS